MRFQPSGLWRQETFLKLWTSQTLSYAGSHIHLLAVPLVAALLLDATPLQMGVLVSSGGVPAIVVGLFAGIWIDRMPKRSVLIGAAWGHVLAFSLIAAAAWLGFLSIPLLVAVAFVLGGLRLISDVTYRAYLPSLVQRGQLIEANSKIEMGRSTGEIALPGLTGALVQVVSAPFTLAVGAVAYAASALSLHRMRSPEAAATSARSGLSVRGELREGLSFVMGNPILRALVVAAAMVGGFNAVLESAGLLYLVRHLGSQPRPHRAGVLHQRRRMADRGLACEAGDAEGGSRQVGGGWRVSHGRQRRDNSIGRWVNGCCDHIAGWGHVPVRGGSRHLHHRTGEPATEHDPGPFAGKGERYAKGGLLGGHPHRSPGRSGALGQTLGLRLTLFVGAGGELLTGAFLLYSAVSAVRELPPNQD